MIGRSWKAAISALACALLLALPATGGASSWSPPRWIEFVSDTDSLAMVRASGPGRPRPGSPYPGREVLIPIEPRHSLGDATELPAEVLWRRSVMPGEIFVSGSVHNEVRLLPL